MMLFVKLFGHTDKPLEETISSVIWVDNAVNGDIWRADGDMECRTRYMEMQVEIYGDAGGDSNSRIKELINTWRVQV